MKKDEENADGDDTFVVDEEIGEEAGGSDTFLDALPREKTLSELSGMGLGAIRKRQKVLSDLTGMDLQDIRQRIHRGNRRTVSDLVAMMNIPEVTTQEQEGRRSRQPSASDAVRRMSYMSGYADLRMAETVHDHGTYLERKTQGLDEQEHVKAVSKRPEGVEAPEDFVFSQGLTSEEAAALLIKYGRNELPEEREPKWLLFLKQFWAPMPIIIWLAIIIEAAISNYIDMGILLLIQFSNASISFYESNKAGNAVAALKSSLKPMGTCKRDGKWSNISATELVPGDLVLLSSGSAIPADCRVNHGEIDVDQAALTGESLPVTFYKGESCKMGSTVVRGEVEATVEFTGANTFFGKTASLLGDTHEHSHLQKILMTIMLVLVFLSILLSGINFVYLLAKGVHLKESLSFTVVLLVSSIPLAIEIVTTTTLAIGSKQLSKHGAIVAKLSAIEDLAGTSILCSDKTGTLTLNKMVLQQDTPVYINGETQESVLVMAALAAKWKEPPRDALDRLVLGSVNMDILEDYKQLDYLPFDPTIKRTEGTVVNSKTGQQFKVTKGAPHIILGLLDSESDRIREAVERDVARLGSAGTRSLAVGRSVKDGKWEMVGLLTFLDPPRPDTKHTIEEANANGVAVKMITGDHLLIAINTSRALGMGGRIFTAERLPLLDEETKKKPVDLAKNYGNLCLAADGFAQVFPEHKYLIVECLREMGYTVGMTGDGVNDAPALKRADVGVAVSGATDAARAAADIVLTQEGLSTIIHGIEIAREIFQRISNFITYRVAATLQLLCFFFIAIFAFEPSSYEQPPGIILDRNEDWPEFFHMPVLMLMLITLLNDGTLITIAYDTTKASDTPNKWNLPALFLVSSVLGIVSLVSSLLLLWLLLDSWNDNGVFQTLGINGVQYGQIVTAIYLKVSVSDFLTLFSARTGKDFFFHTMPAPILLTGGALALILSSILAIAWPESTLDGIPVAGLSKNHEMDVFVFVWVFCLVFWLIQDLLKVATYRLMDKTNFNNVASMGVVKLSPGAEAICKQYDAAMADDDEDDLPIKSGH